MNQECPMCGKQVRVFEGHAGRKWLVSHKPPKGGDQDHRFYCVGSQMTASKREPQLSDVNAVVHEEFTDDQVEDLLRRDRERQR